jgi:hypothetical protein
MNTTIEERSFNTLQEADEYLNNLGYKFAVERSLEYSDPPLVGRYYNNGIDYVAVHYKKSLKSGFIDKPRIVHYKL